MSQITEADVNANGLRTATPDYPKEPDHEEIAVCMRWLAVHAEPRKTTNRELGSYGLKHRVEHWARFARMDASRHQAMLAWNRCHSAAEERRRGGKGPSATEAREAQLAASSAVYERWWPKDVARRLAEAEGPWFQ